MTHQSTIHIDFNEISETLRRGVRRAILFMGVGINASEQKPEVSHVLARDNLHQIQLVKDDLDDDEKAHVATEFGKWVRTNGLRELMESFSIFMFQLYSAVCAICEYQGKEGPHSGCTPERFEILGIGKQLGKLSEVLEVLEHDAHIVGSLNQLRNCYTHRLGLVGPKDADKQSQSLDLLWLAFQLEVVEPNGNTIIENQIFGRVLENGGLAQVRVIEKIKSFQIGTEVILEKRELKEICLSVWIIGERLLGKTLDLARAAGLAGDEIANDINKDQSA